MWTQTTGLLQDLLAVLATSSSLMPAKNSDFLSSPKSSSGHNWLNCWTFCPVLCWGRVLLWLCPRVPVRPALGSGILLQHLAKRPATRFVELDLQRPWSAALQRFAFFLFAIPETSMVVSRMALEGAQQAITVTQANKGLLREQSSFVSQLAFLEI